MLEKLPLNSIKRADISLHLLTHLHQFENTPNPEFHVLRLKLDSIREGKKITQHCFTADNVQEQKNLMCRDRKRREKKKHETKNCYHRLLVHLSYFLLLFSLFLPLSYFSRTHFFSSLNYLMGCSRLF